MDLSQSEIDILKDLNVSRETFCELQKFSDILLKWSEKMNLVSPRDLGNLWTRHIFDSAQLIKYIPQKSSSKIVDIGSGAGFPALILAIFDRSNNYILVEKSRKKCTFLNYVVTTLSLAHVNVVSERIDNLSNLKADIITSRALANMKVLLDFSYPHLSPKGYCLFLKGKNYNEELTNAKMYWKIAVENFSSITDKNACIVKIGAIQPCTPKQQRH